MSFIGALIELWLGFCENDDDDDDDKSKKDEKKDSDDESSESSKDDEEEEEQIGIPDWESEWHDCIIRHDWEELFILLKDYDYKLYKPPPPPPPPPKRQWRCVKYVPERCLNVCKKKPPKDPDPSPLRGMNAKNQVPLHLACIHPCPDKYVIKIVLSERRAAQVFDSEGFLPLHVAVRNRRNNNVVDRIIRADPLLLQKEDRSGQSKTALWYAVEQAVQQQQLEIYNAGEFKWCIPRSQVEKEWQSRQEFYWHRVKFLLLTYSTRRRTFRQSERLLLFQAFEHSAPPSVVELFLFASQRALRSHATLASKALHAFMKYSYPLKNLQLLLHHFPVENVEVMEAARKELIRHYRAGWVVQPPRSESFQSEMERAARDKDYKPSLLCQEWWDQLRCLVRFFGHENVKEHKKKYNHPSKLLHAALLNVDTPPSLIQMFLTMYPKAILRPDPKTKDMPLHLVCGNWKYNLYPPTKSITGEVVKEPSMISILHTILNAKGSPPPNEAVKRRQHLDRLPLHQCIASGKAWDFIHIILSLDSVAIEKRDPVTKLFPCQLAALSTIKQERKAKQIKNAALWAAHNYHEEDWKTLKPEERADAIDKVLEQQDLDQLDIIYRLLRYFPNAVSSAAFLRQPSKFRDDTGLGMVAAHYVTYCYVPTGVADEQEIDQEKFDLILQAIKEKEIPEELEPWWKKLHFWIWYCHPQGDDEFQSASSKPTLKNSAATDTSTSSNPNDSFIPIMEGYDDLTADYHDAEEFQLHQHQHHNNNVDDHRHDDGDIDDDIDELPPEDPNDHSFSEQGLNTIHYDMNNTELQFQDSTFGTSRFGFGDDSEDDFGVLSASSESDILDVVIEEDFHDETTVQTEDEQPLIPSSNSNHKKRKSGKRQTDQEPVFVHLNGADADGEVNNADENTGNDDILDRILDSNHITTFETIGSDDGDDDYFEETIHSDDDGLREEEEFLLRHSNILHPSEAVGISKRNLMKNDETKIIITDIPHNDNDYLLHAAAINPDIPPIIFDLIIAMYPHSASLPVNDHADYPLHLYTNAKTYRPRKFEMKPNRRKTLGLLTKAYPEAASIKSGTTGQFPLQMELARGCDWTQVELLIIEGAQAGGDGTSGLDLSKTTQATETNNNDEEDSRHPSAAKATNEAENSRRRSVFVQTRLVQSLPDLYVSDIFDNVGSIGAGASSNILFDDTDNDITDTDLLEYFQDEINFGRDDSNKNDTGGEGGDGDEEEEGSMEFGDVVMPSEAFKRDAIKRRSFDMHQFNPAAKKKFDVHEHMKNNKKYDWEIEFYEKLEQEKAAKAKRDRIRNKFASAKTKLLGIASLGGAFMLGADGDSVNDDDDASSSNPNKSRRNLMKDKSGRNLANEESGRSLAKEKSVKGLAKEKSGRSLAKEKSGRSLAKEKSTKGLVKEKSTKVLMKGKSSKGVNDDSKAGAPNKTGKSFWGQIRNQVVTK